MKLPQPTGLLSRLSPSKTNLWLLYAFFVGLSLFAVSSAISTLVYESSVKGGLNPIFKHIAVLVVSTGVTIAISQLPVAWYRRYKWVLALGFLAMLGYLIVSPSRTNEADRWIRILGISIQPSEFFKLIIVLYGAEIGALVHKMRRDNTPNEGGRSKFLFWLYWLFVMGITFFLSKTNLSTGIIFVGFMLIYSLILRAPWRSFRILSTAIAAGGVLGFLALYYTPRETLYNIHERAVTWQSRLKNIVHDENPEEYYRINGDNMQEKLGLVALSHGAHIIGSGPGKSKVRDILPMAYSDFIYAIIVEEWGLLGILIVPGLYIWWFMSAGGLARREQNMYRRYLLLGFGILYPMQALINIAVVSGVFMTGQTLPLISDGGSSYLSTSIAMGIMIGIANSQHQLEELKRREEALTAEVQEEA